MSKLTFIIFALIVTGLYNAYAQDYLLNNNKLKFCLSSTWDAGARAGMEYELFPQFSAKTDIGSTLFSLEGSFVITYDVFGVWRLTERNNPFQAELLFGLPYNMIVTGSSAAMFSFGASVDLGYRFNNNFGLYLRGGGGYPLFYSDSKWTGGSAKGVFWPDLALELKYSLY